MYIETVQYCTSHKNMITLDVHIFVIQFRMYLVYFIDMLESGYQIGTEVNFLVRLVVLVIHVHYLQTHQKFQRPRK